MVRISATANTEPNFFHDMVKEKLEARYNSSVGRIKPAERMESNEMENYIIVRRGSTGEVIYQTKDSNDDVEKLNEALISCDVNTTNNVPFQHVESFVPESTLNTSLSIDVIISLICERKLLISNSYVLKKFLGHGGFGFIFMGKDLRTNEYNIVKLQINKKSKINGLKTERRIYESIQGEGFPKMIFSSSNCFFDTLILELLGKNLKDIFNHYGRKFSVKTVAMIAIQCIERIQKLHEKGWIHRDIKPENFVIGRKSKHKSHIIHLIDFGLSTKYVCKDGSHISESENMTLAGTARYASLNMHQAKQQSRRDDLESLAYMLIHFLVGELPWSNEKNSDTLKLFESIGAIKSSVDFESMLKKYPKQIFQFLKYTRNLAFAEDPDYKYLISLFLSILYDNGWIKNEELRWTEKA